MEMAEQLSMLALIAPLVRFVEGLLYLMIFRKAGLTGGISLVSFAPFVLAVAMLMISQLGLLNGMMQGANSALNTGLMLMALHYLATALPIICLALAVWPRIAGDRA